MLEIDYFSLLGLPRHASVADIEEASRRAKRQWTKRSASSIPDVRLEAETRLHQLARAEQSLSRIESLSFTAVDTTAFDSSTVDSNPVDSGPVHSSPVDSSAGATEGPAGTPLPSTSSHDDDADEATEEGTYEPDRGAAGEGWAARARAALAVNDYAGAARAAQRLALAAPGRADAWALRSRASLGLGRIGDALYEARQATALEPAGPTHHFDLGNVLEHLQRWDEALLAYQRAADLDPQSFLYRLASGSVLQQNGFIDDALGIYRALYVRYSHQTVVRYYLALALIEKAKDIPSRTSVDSYMVTRSAEIAPMEALVTEAKRISTHPGIHREADTLLNYLDRSKASVWHVPPIVADRPFVWIGVLVVLVVASITSGNGAFLVVAVAIVGTIAATSHVPQWKRNARASRFIPAERFV